MIWTPVRTLYRRQWVSRSLRETFEFFERPENLQRITPPRLGLRILTPVPIRMTRGLTIDYTVRVLGIRSHWRSLISEYDPPNSFHDVQMIGPYCRWDHRHRFWREDGGTVVEDFVVYALPAGLLGLLLNWLTVRRQLDAIFDFRQAQIARLLGEATAPGALSEARVSAVDAGRRHDLAGASETANPFRATARLSMARGPRSRRRALGCVAHALRRLARRPS